MKKLFIRSVAYMMAVLFLIAAFITVAPIKAHAAEEYTVSGVWVFNDTLDFTNYSDLSSVDVNAYFSGTFTYNIVRLNFSPSNGHFMCITDSGSSHFLYNGSSWSGSNTLDFGDSEQVVPELFYSWLNVNATFQAPPPGPGPLVEAVTDLQDQKILEQVLVPILAILPIGLVCLVGYKGLRKALDLLRGILHQA